MDNGGEGIGLVSASGSVIQNFTYSDADDWPSLADGDGQTLVAIDYAGNYNSPLNWLPSGNGGTPGQHIPPAKSQSDLRVTELHYNPGASAGVEFVELQNTGTSTIDLNGYSFLEGVRFDFSGSAITSLAPGDKVVVTSNVGEFNAYYGAGLPVAGQFISGSLSNGGERIILMDDQNAALHDFVYDDAAPWPVNADGNGQSLEVIDVNGNYSSSLNWNGSSVVGGTPGDDGGNGVPGDFDGDGNLTCADIDALSGESASGAHVATFDLTGDGLVNSDDVNMWVTSLYGTIPGDANLDFNTDISDFNIWNSNKFTAQSGWCSGNFNGDDAVDISDFNVWNANKFTSAIPPAASLPVEPTTIDADRIDSLFEVEYQSRTEVANQDSLFAFRAVDFQRSRQTNRRTPRSAEPVQQIFADTVDDAFDFFS